MNRSEAAALLGVPTDATRADIRRSFRSRIRSEHPDVDGNDGTVARALIAAYRFLLETCDDGTVPDGSDRLEGAPPPETVPLGYVETVSVARLTDDTIALGAPADEAFRLICDAAHDVGEITYLDRSVPIIEVLCRFVGEPATSLVVTVQGRATHTEAFCTVESIEAREAPPTGAVVDLLEDALANRFRP